MGGYLYLKPGHLSLILNVINATLNTPSPPPVTRGGSDEGQSRVATCLPPVRHMFLRRLGFEFWSDNWASRTKITTKWRALMDDSSLINVQSWGRCWAKQLGRPAEPVGLWTWPGIAPVAETGFSHRLTAYKIVGHFFGLSYRNQ